MRVLGVVGKVLIGAGVILLLFAAYQIWGTTYQEEHTQAGLRATLVHQAHDAQLRQALAQAAALNKLPTGPPRAAASTSAPAEGDAVGVIRIPRIGLNQVLVEGTNGPDLRKGPGHYTGTPLPGQFGNAGIAGHRTTYGHPFYSLDAVKVGDPIVVTTVQGIFVYNAVRTQVVSPRDTAVLANTTTGDFLTLTTCNPRFSASTRLIVTALLAHSQLFPNSGLPKGHAQKVQSGDLAGNSNGQLTVALWWGFVWLVVGALVLRLAVRFRRRRLPIYGVGTVALLGLLYVFFTAVTPLLPASF
jgi:sortase A